jgi:glycosyltransferase involved in cell wall biosynthesis
MTLTSVLRQSLFSRSTGADISLFFDFVPPPYGGANQFLHALAAELTRRGLRLENNRISPSTHACLYNSFNFDNRRLRRHVREGCRMVHRVDGPIGAYRGEDDAIDRRIWELNHEWADATIFQSQYSLRKHVEMGLEFKCPTVIPNAVDDRFFHARGRVPFERGRKVRLISVSWSDNPNKGAASYAWLEQHLDWTRYEYTFVGRSAVPFQRIQTVAAVDSARLGAILREHDVYVTASRHDPCSNALLEALSCGLPALYLDSGGHRELVGEGGLPFTDQPDLPEQLDRLVDAYETRQALIRVPSIGDVATRYLAVMNVEGIG